MCKLCNFCLTSFRLNFLGWAAGVTFYKFKIFEYFQVEHWEGLLETKNKIFFRLLKKKYGVKPGDAGIYGHCTGENLRGKT